MAATAAAQAPLTNTYDALPYNSYPFAQTNPLLWQGIARLFGLNAPSPAKARILEIGCAGGGNISSIAARYPHSQCVGIDYSHRQIEEGKRQLEGFNLPNLKLLHLSVTDIPQDLGTFDYIICHGVFSWVPPEVQEKILQVCNERLSPEGIAYVSYNTLPGWNSVRSIREMMLFHVARFDDMTTKAQQARLLLQFVRKGMGNGNDPIANIIDREIELLNNQPDYYIVHEHLEENNIQYYFHEFMAMAQKQGLQYLADTSLATMFSGNMNEETAKVLATGDDLVRTEQYMDFIYNRRFRMTLLCHKDRILNRNIQSDVLKDGFITSAFNYPEGLAEQSLTTIPKPLEFTTGSNMTLSSSDPLIVAMMQVLMTQRHKPIHLSLLFKQIEEKLKANGITTRGDRGQWEEALCLSILRYIFMGGIHFYAEGADFKTEISDTPEALPLARHQAKTQDWVSNMRQEVVRLSPLDRVMLGYVDGTPQKAQDIAQKMLPHFESKELLMHENGTTLEDMAAVSAKLPLVTEQILQRFLDLGLLIK